MSQDDFQDDLIMDNGPMAHGYHPGPGPPPPPPPTGRYILIALAVAILAGVVWMILNPVGTARMIGRIMDRPPVVTALNLRVNGEERDLKPGQFAKLHPQDELVVEGFESNRWYNYDLTMFSPDLNVDSFSQPNSLWKVLGEEAFEKPREFVIQVREGEKVLADFYLLVSMSAMDWAAKADQATDNEQKIRYLRLALELEPKNLAIRNKLAGLFEETKAYDEAADLYNKTLDEAETDEDKRAALNELVRVYQDAKNTVKLLETYEALIKQAPDAQVPQLLNAILKIHQAGKNHAAVVQTYHRLIDVSDDATARRLLRELAELHEKKGEFSKAIKVYQTLRDRLPANERAWALKKLGYLYAKTDEIDRAITAYEAAARADNKDQNLYFNLARLYQSKGDKVKYAENLSKALQLAPGDTDDQMNLALAFLEAGEKDKAEAALRELLKKNPDNLKAHLRLLNLLEEKGDQDGLIEEYRQVIRLDPKNKVLYYNLGVMLFEKGDLKGAQEMMSHAKDLDPEDVETRQYLFEIYRRQEMPEKAVAQAIEILKLKPGQDALYTYVYQYYDEKKDYTTLSELASEWVKQQPDSVKLLQNLAYTQVKLQKWADAAETYEKILKKKPDDLDLLFTLAETYEKAKKLDAAKDAYQRILKIDPDNEKAAEAAVRLSLEEIKTRREP